MSMFMTLTTRYDGTDQKFRLVLAIRDKYGLATWIQPKRHIEDIQIFGMNMPFISLSEVKNPYFMSGKATNETYFFSLHGMK